MGAPGKIDWNSTEAWQKLVSAIIATGVKLDIRAVATHYGTTYDTLENRLRKVKSDALILKNEVANGERGEVAARKSTNNTPKKAKTPKKAGDVLGTVANSRVSKTSPTKKSSNKNTSIKHEALEGLMTDMFSDAPIPFLKQGMSFGTDSFNSQNEEVDASHSLEDFELDGLMDIGTSFQ